MAYPPQKIEVDVEVKCNAQKFWDCIKDYAGFLKAGDRDDLDSVEILAGDGKSAGSIFEVKRKPGHPYLVTKQKLELVDEEKKTLSYSLIGGDVMNHFNSYKLSLVVIPKGDGALIKYTCEFSKKTDQILDDMIRDRIVIVARKIEEFLLKA